MREIKFRVWDGQNKVMINDIDIWYGIGSRVDETANYLEIMQYTGLKDNSGKEIEIYEGDVVKPLDVNRANYIVYWGDACWNVECVQDVYFKRQHLTDHSWKVIGNIYENPELLGEK